MLHVTSRVSKPMLPAHNLDVAGSLAATKDPLLSTCFMLVSTCCM